MRLDKQRVEAEESNLFFENSSNYIAAQKHGFRVTIREKKHLTIMEMIKSRSADAKILFGPGHFLLKQGNCIVAAFLHCISAKEAELNHIASVDQENPPRVDQGICTRSFQELVDVFKAAGMRAYVGPFPSYAFPFMVHTADRGIPVTFAVWPCSDPKWVNVGYSDRTMCLTTIELDGIFATATDRASVTSFVPLSDAQSAEYPPRAFEATRAEYYEKLLQIHST